jgi:hypothetical protein
VRETYVESGEHTNLSSETIVEATVDEAQPGGVAFQTVQVTDQLPHVLPSHRVQTSLHHLLHAATRYQGRDIAHQKSSDFLTPLTTYVRRRAGSSVLVEVKEMAQLEEVGACDVHQHLQGARAHA